MKVSPETQFIEAMLDVSRIEIAALLARQALPVDKIAEALSMPRGQVLRHLATLRMAGLVAVDATSGQELYNLDRAAFETLSRSIHEARKNVDALYDELDTLTTDYEARSAVFDEELSNLGADTGE